MSTKTLRLLIADADLQQRIRIEKMLNLMGYHRIAPLSSFDELRVLTRSGGVAFDLLIINSALVSSPQENLLAYCHGNPLIRHTLIYDGQCAPHLLVLDDHPSVHLSVPHLPDFIALQHCMGIVDPAPRVRTAGSPGLASAHFHGCPASVACAVGLSPRR
jgi:hypothetical protein